MRLRQGLAEKETKKAAVGMHAAANVILDHVSIQWGRWDTIDMTDNIGRWDLSQLGGGMTMTWDQAEAFIMTAYPNHRVIYGSLVDDSCSFATASCGQAYYDLFTFENRTLEQDQDTVKNGQ